MTVQEYFAVKGSRYTRADAETIGPELTRLQDSHGDVKPSDILAAAKHRESPLHPYFEWNNETAAHRFRKLQARDMVQSIRVRVREAEGETERVFRTAKVRATPAEKPTSAKADTAESAATARDEPATTETSRMGRRAEPDPAKVAIDQADAALERWRERYEPYVKTYPKFAERFADVFAAVRRMRTEES